MKTKIIVLFALIFIATACQDKVYNKYLANVPQYTSYEEFRTSIKFETPHEPNTKGNIYIYNDYLFVSEPNEGIHFIDNFDPSNPNNIGFLRIKGNTGLVIKGDYLYANALIDLVVIDVSNVTQPIEINRIKDVFPAALPPSKANYPIAGSIDKNKGVVTDWKIEEVKEKTEDIGFNNCPNCDIFITAETNGFTTNSTQQISNNTPQGISGSITKMTLVNNYLYVMETNVLIPFNLDDPINPKFKTGIGVWREVETLFANNNNIFMGTTTGMLIYDTSNPDVPNYVATLNHMRGCDPVVVQNDYAYVTIRSGATRCSGAINQLDIVDVSDIYNPILENSFPMQNPYGLGIDGNTLFVCDGDAGLKIFDATNPINSGDELIKEYKNIQATDVIPFNDIAILIGDDGIYQYNYADNQNVELLSKIKF